MEDNDKPLDSFILDSTRYKTTLTDKYSKRLPYKAANPYEIKAVIPGTVLKILVKPGQKVTEGKPVLILEAMKMKNRILPEVSGIVKAVFVEEGQIVSKNHILIELLAPEEAKSLPKEKKVRRIRATRGTRRVRNKKETGEPGS